MRLVPSVLWMMVAVSGCGGPSLKSTGGQCSGGTTAGAAQCQGGVCIGLDDNAQHAPGICAAPCGGGCGEHERCIANFPDGNSYCLRSCAADSDCVDGFVCLLDDASGAHVCWVQRAAAGGTPPPMGTTGGTPAPGGPVDCSACIESLTGANDLQSYCGGVANAARVCDCPNAAPSPSCQLSPSGAANVYCCP